MLKAFKKWLAKAAYDGLSENQARIEDVRTNKLHDMLSNNMAAMVAFKIDNGFIVRTMNPDAMIHGERLPGFVYCADHQAIADHIVSSAMKERLGVQQELPLGKMLQDKLTAGQVHAVQAKANPVYVSR